jgi:hypothetical protein
MPIKIIKRQINKNPKIHNPSAQWSDKQKFEAVTSYLLVGKWPLVAEATGIPIDTLKKWKASKWWKEMEDEVRHSSNVEMSASLKRVREKALKEVEDRLDNGEFHINPNTGNITRRPVQMRVAAEIAIKSIDREILLQKLEEKPKVQEEEIVERLKTIEAFLIKGARKKAQIIDAEVIENGEGLPAGESQLQIEARADQNEGGEEQSPQDHGGSGVGP